MSRHDRIIRSAPPEPTRSRALVPVAAGPSLLGWIGHLFLTRRPPLRLLAVPRDPVAGDKAVGAALLNGRLLAEGQDLALERLDPADSSLPPEVAERLHSFAWLRDLGAAATHDRGSPLAEKLTRAWLDAHGAHLKGPGWRADLAGRRILFWTAYAPYILATRDADYRKRVLGLIVEAGRQVERGADRLPPGLARIVAWSGAVGAGLTVQSLAPRLARYEAGLARAIRTGLSDDGGLVSRAPHEQLVLVDTFAMLRGVYATSTRGMPDWLEDGQEGALSALLCVTLGDAGLSSWQGGNAGDPYRIVAAMEGAAANTRPLRQARGWGYQRLQAKESILVMDAGPPPAPRALTGGCASTLAFELSDGPQRLIVNCGGAGQARSAVPNELAHLLRSTAAHSTLVLGDRNSTAILENGALGRGVGELALDRGVIDGAHRIEASHDGYLRRFGLIHQRRLVLSADGRTLEGEDALVVKDKPKRGDVIPFAVRFHLAPGVEVTSTADGKGALLRVRGQKAWQFRCRGGMLSVEDSIWLDGEARPRATVQLVITGETPTDGMTISWELKRAG